MHAVEHSGRANPPTHICFNSCRIGLQKGKVEAWSKPDVWWCPFTLVVCRSFFYLSFDSCKLYIFLLTKPSFNLTIFHRQKHCNILVVLTCFFWALYTAILRQVGPPLFATLPCTIVSLPPRARTKHTQKNPPFHRYPCAPCPLRDCKCGMHARQTDPSGTTWIMSHC